MHLSPFRFLALYAIIGWIVVWPPAAKAQPAPNAEQALAQVLAMPDDTNKVQALLLHIRQSQTKAIIMEAGHQMRAISARIGYPHGEAQACNVLGVLYLNQDRTDSGFFYLNRANMLAVQANDAQTIANVSLNLGHLYQNISQFDSAVVAFMRAVRQQEALGNIRSTGMAWVGITECYLMMKIYDRAIEGTHTVEALAQKTGDAHNLAAAYTYRGQAYAALGRKDEAERLLLKAIEIAKTLSDPIDEMAAYAAYADFLNNNKSYHKAIKVYQTLLSYPKFSWEGQRYAFIQNQLAKAYIHTNQFPEGKIALERAEAAALQANAPLTLLDNTEYWVRYYLAQTPGGEARFDQYIAWEDSLFSAEKTRITLDLQTRYETEKKDKLLAEQQIQLLEAENRKVLLFAALILLALLAGVAVWLYRTNRFKERTNRQLEKLNTELNTLNGVKDRLLSLIAHDLRSPLSALSASVQLFQRGRVQPDRMTAFADEMQQALANTVGMMDTLLQWSRSQMQGILPKPVPIVVASLADEVRQMAEVIAAPKQIVIDCGDVDEAASLFADPNMLRIVLYNLVNNAVKFTDSNGLVAIRTEEAGPGKWALVVQDTGVGMTAAQLATIGKRMESTRGTAGERGTGLGLEMVHRFVEANGGTLAFASTLGEGTTATVVLPATAPDALAG